MSILSVDEEYEGRGGSINRAFERRYTRVFDVTTSDPLVGPLAVRADVRLPQIGHSYTNGAGPYDPLLETDTGAFANEITAECVGGPEGAGIHWRVTVQYEPWDPFDSDVLSQKVRVQFAGERTERVIDFDKDGVPVRNSAGDRFGDPVTVDAHITTMVITRNELVSAFDIELASLYSDTINNATWNGIPAFRAKMGIITTSEEQYDSVSQRWYYTVTYPVQLSRTAWRKDLLDQGYNVLVAGRPKAILDPDGQPVTDPRALDGSGGLLGIGDPPVPLTFDVFDEADWSGLNIDLSLRLGL
jgi:hypothetical protein